MQGPATTIGSAESSHILFLYNYVVIFPIVIMFCVNIHTSAFLFFHFDCRGWQNSMDIEAGGKTYDHGCCKVCN
jgi:hypothetical protein